MGLARFHGQPLFHQLPEREFIRKTPVNARNRNPPALAAGNDRLSKRVGPLGPEVSVRLYRVDQIVDRNSVAFHADAIDHRVGADTAGHLLQSFEHVDFAIIQDVGAHLLGELQSRGIMIDRDHPVRTQQEGRLDGEQSNRAAAPNRDRVARLDPGILRRLPAGWKNIRKEQDLVVLEPVGNDDRPDIAERHPDIFGLSPGIAAGQMREPERSAHRVPHHRLRKVGGFGRIAVFAGAELLLVAKKAAPARDDEGHHHALTLLERRLGADFDHLAHELVAKHVAGPKRRDVTIIKVEVRTADRGRSDLQDHVARIDDFGIGNGFDPNVVAPLPGECTHWKTPKFGLRSGSRTFVPKARR